MFIIHRFIFGSLLAGKWAWPHSVSSSVIVDKLLNNSMKLHQMHRFKGVFVCRSFFGASSDSERFVEGNEGDSDYRVNNIFSFVGGRIHCAENFDR